MYWTMKNGKEILYTDMSDSHLNNAIRLVEKWAQEGITITSGCSFFDKFEYDQEELYGSEVYQHFGYYGLKREQNLRKKRKNEEL